jgi:hypothetical protein
MFRKPLMRRVAVVMIALLGFVSQSGCTLVNFVAPGLYTGAAWNQRVRTYRLTDMTTGQPLRGFTFYVLDYSTMQGSTFEGTTDEQGVARVNVLVNAHEIKPPEGWFVVSVDPKAKPIEVVMMPRLKIAATLVVPDDFVGPMSLLLRRLSADERVIRAQTPEQLRKIQSTPVRVDLRPEGQIYPTNKNRQHDVDVPVGFELQFVRVETRSGITIPTEVSAAPQDRAFRQYPIAQFDEPGHVSAFIGTTDQRDRVLSSNRALIASILANPAQTRSRTWQELVREALADGSTTVPATQETRSDRIQSNNAQR